VINEKQQPHRLVTGLTKNIFQRLERKLTASPTSLLGLSDIKLIELNKVNPQAEEAQPRTR